VNGIGAYVNYLRTYNCVGPLLSMKRKAPTYTRPGSCKDLSYKFVVENSRILRLNQAKELVVQLRLFGDTKAGECRDKTNWLSGFQV
jgi:hypothetical protein